MTRYIITGFYGNFPNSSALIYRLNDRKTNLFGWILKFAQENVSK